MIQRTHSDTRSTLHGHVLREIRVLSRRPGSATPEHADDIATGIVQYLADQACNPAKQTRHTRALVARALSGCGYGDSGRHSLLELSRIVRASHWAVVGDAPVVALDLARLFEGETAGMELMIQHAVGRVLTSLEHIWDESNGSGFLGLRNTSAVASHTLQRPEKDHRSRALASDIRDYCESALLAAASRRGWGDTPGILDLDGVHRK